MELETVTVVIPSRFTEWTLHAVGDVHWGAKACDDQAFKDKVKEIADDPNARWIGMGDMIDGIGHKDPRFDPKGFKEDTPLEALDNIFTYQARGIYEVLEPIKGKCLGMLCGNHEESIRLHNIQDPAKSLASWLGVHDLRYAGALRVVVHDETSATNGRYQIIVYAHHGWAGGRFTGGKVHKVDQHTNDQAPANASIVLIGHVHALIGGKKPWLRVAEDGELVVLPYERVYAVTGTYLKNWVPGSTTYSERKGYPMVPIGSPEITIKLCVVQIENSRGRKVEREIPRYKVTT